jgi:hypothetical protein
MAVFRGKGARRVISDGAALTSIAVVISLLVRGVLLSLGVNESGHPVVHGSAPSQDEFRIWTFAKGADELTIEQWLEGQTVVVALTRSDQNGAETVRAYEFPDESAADEFHAGLDSSLLEFGWSFIGHLPERRMGSDRRQQVRRCDRRRWWTDGALMLE